MQWMTPVLWMNTTTFLFLGQWQQGVQDARSLVAAARIQGSPFLIKYTVQVHPHTKNPLRPYPPPLGVPSNRRWLLPAPVARLQPRSALP